MRNLAILLIFASLFLTGCAGIKNNNIAVIGDGAFPRDNDKEKTRIFYRVIYHSNMDISSTTISENAQEGEFIRAVRNSECCTVTTDETNSDVQVRVTINKYENPLGLIPAVITGASFYIIPSWATSEYTFNVNVVAQNKQVHNYEVKDAWTLVQWFPMMFVFPFATPDNAEEHVLRNMHKYLLYILKNDNII
ncbi:MAG: hypothetical protein OEL83_19345 [Desulforhopalus sp.]|nr:hypothetical protein [Desulforhopalus sp.]